MFKSGLNLLLKLNLFVLMLLFEEFFDCVHSNSARIELITPTDAQTVSWYLIQHDLIAWYIFDRKGMKCLSRSLNSHSILCITVDSCAQVYSHHQPTP